MIPADLDNPDGYWRVLGLWYSHRVTDAEFADYLEKHILSHEDVVMKQVLIRALRH